MWFQTSLLTPRSRVWVKHAQIEKCNKFLGPRCPATRLPCAAHGFKRAALSLHCLDFMAFGLFSRFFFILVSLIFSLVDSPFSEDGARAPPPRSF